MRLWSPAAILIKDKMSNMWLSLGKIVKVLQKLPEKLTYWINVCVLI